jgi:hypothetical protein
MPNEEFLAIADDYMARILRPDYDEFFAGPATLRSAVHLANSLYHMHEWMHDSYKSELEAHFSKSLPAPSSLWAEVEVANPLFGHIRDLANASKHVRLTRKPSTTATHVANTVLTVPKWDKAVWDKAKWDTPQVVTDSGGANVYFDDVASQLFTFWQTLLALVSQLSGK